MIINVKVIPNSKKEEIKQENNIFKIHLKAQAIEGKANKALIAFLSAHFKTKKHNIRIIRGLRAREKVIELLEPV